jgi:hypothetical protein
MIWSNDAPAGEIDRGAASFGDETSAEKFFREDLDGEELADNEEFLKALSFYEVELDVTPEGHTRPRRVSADKLAEIGIRIPSSVPAA